MRIIVRPLLYFTIAMSALGAYTTVSTHISAEKSLSWPDTKGVIIDSDIVEMRNVGDGMTAGFVEYEAFVRYRYSANGQEHVSSTISFPNPPFFTDRASANNFLRGYPLDAKVVVYYNPRDADESCLERAGGASLSYAIGGFLMFTVIAALCIYGLKIIPAGGNDDD